MSSENTWVTGESVIRINTPLNGERAIRLITLIGHVYKTVPQVQAKIGEFSQSWKASVASDLLAAQGNEEPSDEDIAKAMVQVGNPPPHMVAGLVAEDILNIVPDSFFLALSLVTVSDAAIEEAMDKAFPPEGKYDQAAGDEAVELLLARQQHLLRKTAVPSLLEMFVQAVPAVMKDVEAVSGKMGKAQEALGMEPETTEETETSEQTHPSGPSEPSGSQTS